MVKKVIFAFLVPLLLASCGGQKLPDGVIELPITWHHGVGPMVGQSYGHVSTDPHPMDNALRRQAGALPDDIFDVRIGTIILSHYQVLYQEHLAGEIPQEMYEYYSTGWDTYDESILSKKPIRSYILVAVGRDAEGNPALIVDANANNDFTDDPRVVLADLFDETAPQTVIVEYDRYAGGRLFRVKRPLAIYSSPRDEYMFGFYDYATIEKDGRIVGVLGNNLREQDASFEVAPIIDGDTVTEVTNCLRPGEYLPIDGTYYKIINLSDDRNGLLVEPMPQGELYSTQVGMKPHPFSGKDMTTGREVSLDDYRGKFVFVDIWSRGCGPCVAEMPTLAKIYDATDRSRLEFIGIVEQDDTGAAAQIMERNGVKWPTIMNSPENDILTRYNVTSYPTTLLLSPDGVVLSKSSCHLVVALYQYGAISHDEYKVLSKELYGWDVLDEEMEQVVAAAGQ